MNRRQFNRRQFFLKTKQNKNYDFLLCTPWLPFQGALWASFLDFITNYYNWWQTEWISPLLNIICWTCFPHRPENSFIFFTFSERNGEEGTNPLFGFEARYSSQDSRIKLERKGEKRKEAGKPVGRLLIWQWLVAGTMRTGPIMDIFSMKCQDTYWYLGFIIECEREWSIITSRCKTEDFQEWSCHFWDV